MSPKLGQPTWSEALGVPHTDQTGVVHFGLGDRRGQTRRQVTLRPGRRLTWNQRWLYLQRETRPCPACTWRRCRSECCCCRRSRPGSPPSPARCSPCGRWSRRTRCRRSCGERLGEDRTALQPSLQDADAKLTRWCAAGSRRPCSPEQSCSGSAWTWPCRRPSGSRPASPRSPARRRPG